MKFKLVYFTIGYEISTFIYEMYKRKASKIRLEFQGNTGKFCVYLDDSAFKTIDSRLGWGIIKKTYTYITKKKNFDKETDFNGEISEEQISSLSDKYNLTLLPLPKGKCIKYSYTKKEGDIYIATFAFTENNLYSFVEEQCAYISKTLKESNVIFKQDKQKDEFKVENIVFNRFVNDDKKSRIYVSGVFSNDPEHNIDYVFYLSQFKNKKEIQKFFSSFLIKKQYVEIDNKINKNKDDENKNPWFN